MDNYYDSIDIQVSRAGGGSLEAAFLNIPQLLCFYRIDYLDSSLFSRLLCSPDSIKVIIKYKTVSTRYVSANLNVLPEYSLPL